MNFTLDIVTPDARIYSGEVSAVKLPGTNGSFSILHNHAPLISSLGKGLLEITEANGKKIPYTTEGGVAEVLNNKVSVLIERVLSGENQNTEA